MKAIIISCGDELVTGQCVDTNSAWLSAQLAACGIEVAEHVTVGDSIPLLRNAIERTMSNTSLLIITGGLGPTPDDITRDALAEAISAPLEENAEAALQIRAFFERFQRPMPDSNLRQAMIPRGCRVVENPHGTAPGIAWESADVKVFALPGVPAEMKPMFNEHVRAAARAASAGAFTLTARLLCFGISEARLGEQLGDLMARGRNPSVGTTASHAVLSVRIVARGSNEAAAKKLLDGDIEAVRARLGNLIFGDGDETLQLAVARLLTARSKTISIAESCTGGLISKCLTDVPGSSAYFLRGYVTYANEAKAELLGVPAPMLTTHGAASEETARAMAIGCRQRAGTDLSLAVTGIAGPDGGSPPERPVGLVYIALAHADTVDIHRLLLGDHLSREEIRDRASKHALNYLRIHLLKTPPS